MDEPIAIIGLDARLPGDGDTAEHFYQSLLAGRSARTEVPPERFNVDAFYHPDAERSGSVRVVQSNCPRTGRLH
jgi:acyl transferase domain-containing protein